MVLVVDENVVETFASNRADETLDVAVRFWRQNGRANDPDARAFSDIIEDGAKLGVVVAQKELRSLTTRGQFPKLLGQPLAAGSARSDDAKDSPGFEVHDDECEVATEPEVTHFEKVAAPDPWGLVSEECRPALTFGRHAPETAHVALDGALGDGDSELEELAADALGTPEAILEGDAPDERDDLSGQPPASGRTRFGLLPPNLAKWRAGQRA
jgi:hypothetical protein